MEQINKDYEYCRKKAIEFIRNNRGLYGFFELECLIDVLKTAKCPDLFIMELVREVLDELGFIPDQYNIYKQYTDLIDSIHGIEGKNIVEIGGGRFPRLAKRMSSKQKIGKITVYDPNLYSDKSTDKLVLKKKRASRGTDVGDCNLIVGLMPCKGAEVLLDLAIDNKKDFVLWLCEGGPHGDEFDFFEDEDEWRNYMIEKARKGVKDNEMGELKIKKLTRFSDSYPIIYNKRSVQE